jgi:hypothetical protein
MAASAISIYFIVPLSLCRYFFRPSADNIITAHTTRIAVATAILKVMPSDSAKILMVPPYVFRRWKISPGYPAVKQPEEYNTYDPERYVHAIPSSTCRWMLSPALYKPGRYLPDLSPLVTHPSI